MNTVERIKMICKERKIPISKLERDLGFSNAYIAGLRKGTVPDDRLNAIAKYFDVSVEYLITGEIPNVDIEKYDTFNARRIARFTAYSNALLNICEKYAKLPDNDRKIVTDMINSLSEKNEKK